MSSFVPHLPDVMSYPTLFEWDTIKECDDQYLMDCALSICQLVTKFRDVSKSFQKVSMEREEFRNKFLSLTEKCRQLENCQNCASLQNKLDDHVSKMQTLAEVFGQVSNNKATLTNMKMNKKIDFEKVQDIFTQMVDNCKSQESELENKTIVYGKRKITNPVPNNLRIKTDEPVILSSDSTGCVTPQKRLRTRVSPRKLTGTKRSENQMDGNTTSPILGKNKSTRSMTKSQENKLPLANLSNRFEEMPPVFSVISPVKQLSSVEKKFVKEASPSLLGNPKTDDEKTPSPHYIPRLNSTHVKHNTESDQSGSKENKRNSFSLLQNNAKIHKQNDTADPQLKLSKKSPRSKKFKQARLSFSKLKSKKNPTDVSQVNSFCGGLRRFSTEGTTTKTEEEMFKIAVQLSLNENLKQNAAEDEDIIDASPSNQPMFKQRKHKVQALVHRTESPSKISPLSTKMESPSKKMVGSPIKRQKDSSSHIHNDGDSMSIADEEETMLFTPQIKRSSSPLKRNSELSIVSDKIKPNNNKTIKVESLPKSSDKGNNELLQRQTYTSLKKSDRNHTITSNEAEPDYVYIEPVVRKKAEKKKLPGWSCKKCKDFYEAAFKGNERMIRAKMNECSKHRGKFNPERMDTPAGFWELNMSLLQDTE